MANSRNLIEITTKSTSFWAGILAILAVSSLLYINFSRQQSDFLESTFNTRNETLITMAASYASPFLQTRNIISLNLLLKEITSRPEVLSGRVTDGNGDVLTEYGDIRAKGVGLNQPIHFDTALIGYMQLTILQNTENSNLLISAISFSILGILGWILFSIRQTLQNIESWDAINKQLAPVIESQALDPGNWLTDIKEKAKPALTIVAHLRQRLSQTQFDLLARSQTSSPSQFHHAVVLHCASINTNQDALENQANAQKLQIWLDQVAHIYQGTRVENGNYLVFGMEEDENMAVNALCAARVLYFLCQNSFPCAISLSAGEIWSGSGLAPWPIIKANGRPIDDLSLIHLNNPGDHILMAESLFQHADLSDRINASIFKDVNTSRGRLEVWQLDNLKDQYDALLRHQADRLPDMQ